MPEPGRDPVDRLRSLSTLGGDMHPLPPHEVRRRGDRRRRRRQRTAVLGSMAVVAAVAGGGVTLGAVLGGSDAPDPASPASTSTAPAPSGPTTSVPDDFALDAGWPDGRVVAIDPAVEGLTDLVLCDDGQLFFDETGAADVEAVAHRGDGGWEDASDTRDRALATYDDQDAAALVLQQAREVVELCADAPENEEAGYDAEARETGVGDDSVLVTETYGAEGEDDSYVTYHFVRVANAVLVSSYEPIEASPDAATQEDDLLGTDEDVVAAMERAFVGAPPATDDPPEPDPTEGPTDDGAGDTSVPADRLLTVDELPDLGPELSGWESLEPGDAATLACQQGPLATLGPGAVGYAEFAVGYAGDESGQPGARVQEAVLAFDGDDAAAEAAYETVRGWVEDCSTTADDRDVVRDGTTPESPDGLPSGTEGGWWQREYLAPEACGGSDCDAAWFDLMGVVLAGDQVVLVSFAQVGGPLEPEGLAAGMDGLLVAATERATGDR